MLFGCDISCHGIFLKVMLYGQPNVKATLDKSHVSQRLSVLVYSVPFRLEASTVDISLPRTDNIFCHIFVAFAS